MKPTKLKPKGRKWDGKSRVSNDLYRKNWNEIFKKRDEKKLEHINLKEKYASLEPDPFKNEQDELKESYEQSKLNKKEREKLLKELDERNGF